MTQWLGPASPAACHADVIYGFLGARHEVDRTLHTQENMEEER